MKKLVTVVFIKACVMLFLILYGSIGLGPDEAQYWTWSQVLDVGYYSKPPGIAWLIFLGTMLFGNSELGVRFFSLMIGAIVPFLIYALARACRVDKIGALLAGVIMALTPLGFLSSFLATTDVPMVFFWTLGLIVMVIPKQLQELVFDNEKVLKNQRFQTPSYYSILGNLKVLILGTFSKLKIRFLKLIGFIPNQRPLFLGLCIAAGALFKWPIYLLWLFALPVMSWNLSLLFGMALSLTGLLPSLIWNINHDFATFKHVSQAVYESASRGNPLEFALAQFALFSPILFGLLLAALFTLFRKERLTSSSYLGLMSGLILLSYFATSFFKKIQGNWSVFAYPGAIVFLSDYVYKSHRLLRFTKVGIVVSVVLTFVVFFIPFPEKISPFKHNLGWQKLSQVLEQGGFDGKHHFLFADKYQMASELSFYGPHQKRAYFLNFQSSRKNQFSFWPQMSDVEVGNSGYFATPSKDSIPLEDYFDQVHFKGYFSLTKNKEIALYECIGYTGKIPDDGKTW